jgi:hypothetical protein
MKKSLLFVLLISNLSFGQFFIEQENSEDGQNASFATAPEPNMGRNEEDIEPPPPNAPIDDYLIYLTILGVLIGVMVHNSKAKMRV